MSSLLKKTLLTFIFSIVTTISLSYANSKVVMICNYTNTNIRFGTYDKLNYELPQNYEQLPNNKAIFRPQKDICKYYRVNVTADNKMIINIKSSTNQTSGTRDMNINNLLLKKELHVYDSQAKFLRQSIFDVENNDRFYFSRDDGKVTEGVNITLKRFPFDFNRPGRIGTQGEPGKDNSLDRDDIEWIGDHHYTQGTSVIHNGIQYVARVDQKDPNKNNNGFNYYNSTNYLPINRSFNGYLTQDPPYQAKEFYWQQIPMPYIQGQAYPAGTIIFYKGAYYTTTEDGSSSNQAPIYYENPADPNNTQWKEIGYEWDHDANKWHDPSPTENQISVLVCNKTDTKKTVKFFTYMPDYSSSISSSINIKGESEGQPSCFYTKVNVDEHNQTDVSMNDTSTSSSKYTLYDNDLLLIEEEPSYDASTDNYVIKPSICKISPSEGSGEKPKQGWHDYYGGFFLDPKKMHITDTILKKKTSLGSSVVVNDNHISGDYKPRMELESLTVSDQVLSHHAIHYILTKENILEQDLLDVFEYDLYNTLIPTDSPYTRRNLGGWVVPFITIGFNIVTTGSVLGVTYNNQSNFDELFPDTIIASGDVNKKEDIKIVPKQIWELIESENKFIHKELTDSVSAYQNNDYEISHIIPVKQSLQVEGLPTDGSYSALFYKKALLPNIDDITKLKVFDPNSSDNNGQYEFVKRIPLDAATPTEFYINPGAYTVVIVKHPSNNEKDILLNANAGPQIVEFMKKSVNTKVPFYSGGSNPKDSDNYVPPFDDHYYEYAYDGEGTYSKSIELEPGRLSHIVKTDRNTKICINTPIGSTYTDPFNGKQYLVVNNDMLRDSILIEQIRNGQQRVCTTFVTDMAQIFESQTGPFTGDISDWDTHNVKNMSYMFANTDQFNINIGGWDTKYVKNMQGMFENAEAFNQNIGSWDTYKVTDMSDMFRDAKVFNQPIGDWDTRNVKNMQGMFYEAIEFNQPIGDWDTRDAKNMSKMFMGAKKFNQPLSNWDTQNVEDMSEMFSDAKAFNKDLNFSQLYYSWDTSNVKSMKGMFKGALAFNQPIGDWDTNSVTDMREMFYLAEEFNQDITDWDTSNVTNMAGMFAYTEEFNQNISIWNTSNVTNMSQMFKGARKFDQLLLSSTISGHWDISNVTDMSGMFDSAMAFDQAIYNWDTSSITDMSKMFAYTKVFNQDISEWDTSNVTNMQMMFYQAKAFNQNLTSWNVNSVTHYLYFYKDSVMAINHVPNPFRNYNDKDTDSDADRRNLGYLDNFYTFLLEPSDDYLGSACPVGSSCMTYDSNNYFKDSADSLELTTPAENTIDNNTITIKTSDDAVTYHSAGKGAWYIRKPEDLYGLVTSGVLSEEDKEKFDLFMHVAQGGTLFCASNPTHFICTTSLDSDSQDNSDTDDNNTDNNTDTGDNGGTTTDPQVEVVECLDKSPGSTFLAANGYSYLVVENGDILGKGIRSRNILEGIIKGNRRVCTSHVTDMSSLFSSVSVADGDLSTDKWDFGYGVEIFDFKGDISDWDISNVTNISNMFDNIKNKEYLDLFKTKMEDASTDDNDISVVLDFLNYRRLATHKGAHGDTQKFVTGDFDGDGFDDVIKIFNDAGETSFDILTNKDNNTEYRRLATRKGGHWDSQKFVSGDFDGDGVDDIVKIFNDLSGRLADVITASNDEDSLRIVNRSNNDDDNGETSFDILTNKNGNIEYKRLATRKGAHGDNQKFVSGDFDGDGVDDVVKVFNDAGETSFDILTNKDGTPEYKRLASRKGGHWDSQKFVSGDFDGNGLDDVVKVFNDAGETSFDILEGVGIYSSLIQSSN